MQTLNKRGLSNLISNILIILMVIAVIGTLSAQTFKLINSPALSPETSCPLIYSKNIIDIQKSCYNELTQETELRISRTSEKILISSLKFSYDQETYSCGNTCGTCNILEQRETRTYYFPGNPEEITIFLNNCFMETKRITTNC